MVKMIISKQNEKIKRIRSLKEKKFRETYGEYVALGYKLCLEALKMRLPVVQIVATEKMMAFLNLTEGQTSGYEVISVSDEVFASLTDEASPQGVLTVIKKPEAKAKSPKGDCLLLDKISDPGNLGTIIRTAAACDITELYLIDSVDPFSSKTVRSAMGGLFRVNVYECGYEEAVSVIDKPIIVADMDGENVFNYNVNGDFCLVVGNEANGVSEFVKNNAKIKVSVPMANDVESLNAGVSAGIIMYALKNRKK